MPLDPSIALQAQTFDPSAAYTRAVQLRSLLGQQQLQDLQIDQATRQQRDEQTLADLYRGNVSPDGSVNRQGLFQAAAQQGLGAKIPGMQKQFSEADKAAADLRNVNSQISERDLKTNRERLNVLQGTVASLAADPALSYDKVLAAVHSLVTQGVTTDEHAVQFLRGVPDNNPQALRQALITIGLQAADNSKRLDMMTPKFEKVDAGNRILTGTTNPMTGQFTPAASTVKAPEGFVVGPDGRLTADPGWMDAKTRLAKAGKTDVNLNVNTQKSLTGEMAQGLGKQLDESLAGAQTAQQTIATTQKLQGLLNNGNLITGPGADARMLVNQIAGGLGVGGASDAEKLANTRQVIQGLAQLELQAGAQMKGQGQITEGERAILRNAAAGQITMSGPELKALAQTLEDRAYKRIEAHQSQVQRLGAVQGAEPLMPFYQVQAPPRAAVVAPPTDWKGAGYASKAQAVQDALGAIQRGADKAAVIQRLEAAGITNHGIK